ncbi:hypothetical protein MesoLj113c_43870 [Mesorhizobium sp. 113-3-9]|uniref:DUF2971 domain-containing protein n=1 Tax=Mesorhizobium sp. 113-3-9 TaxID=2744517 RepID=UPI00192702C9|nr:DUF2971 domain-containing protein [Mesorhizobium sp. 113-3-9]BCG88277.1 hypothetical protein MesoLj113c_43870 [Mesorhizobium sp. 113-3-9]
MAYFEYQPTTPLFCYTNTEGFQGIIRSKKLWLSDITASNDPRELQLGQQFLAEAIKNFKDNDVVGVSNRDVSGFLADLLRLERMSTHYACCFALDGDELPMWREYAAGGSGVSIGFRPTAITSIPGRVQLVRYAEDDMKEFFREMILKLAAVMGKRNTLPHVLAAAEALAVMSSLKHRSWRYEREVRIIFNQRNEKPDPKDFILQVVSSHPDGKQVLWREPLVRQSRGREVRYMDFEYGRYVKGTAEARRSIDTIYRGPKCEMSMAEINALLVAEGFVGFKVLQSECVIQ